jgi:hypothetical protein
MIVKSVWTVSIVKHSKPINDLIKRNDLNDQNEPNDLNGLNDHNILPL